MTHPSTPGAAPTVAEPAGRRRSSLGRDVGAVSIELTGILIVAVLLAGALIAAAAPGGPLNSSVSALYCRAFSFFGVSCDGSAGAEGEDGGRDAPDEPCVASSKADTKSIGVTIAVVDVDGGGTVTMEKMSDGTYKVTYQGDVTVGGGIGVGGGVKVTVDDEDYGALASAGLGYGGKLAGGASWEFDNEGDAQKLVDYYNKELTYDTTPVVGGAWRFFDKAVDWFQGDSYSPPEPVEYFGEIGAYGTAGAEATGLTQAAGANAKASAALGAKYNSKTGDTTLYYNVTIDGSASVRNLDASADASGELTTVVAVTISKDGYVSNISGEASAYGEAGYDMGMMFNAADDVSGGTTYGYSLDLTSAENARIAADLLRASGIPIPKTKYDVPGGPEKPAIDALQTVVDAAMDRGDIFRKTYEGDSNTAFGLSASGKLGIGLGVRYDNSTKERELTGAQYFDGKKWVDWTSCYSG